MEQHRRLVTQMLKPGFFGPSASETELIETHASWIFLCSDHAYKMKKPVNFGFLDFSTLAKRHFFCSEELRLNRRFAPELYLAVIPVGGTFDQPLLNTEPALAHLVKMRRFPQENQLDRMLAAGKLSIEALTTCARTVASVHQQADKAAPDTPFGTADSVIKPVRQNFIQIRSALPETMSAERVNHLEAWSETIFARLRPVIAARREQGFIRECHGDLHLANMAWFHHQPLLFDCIEFNENLRWIDVINDVAFLVMDLDERGQQQLAWAFLNAYLRHTGDYAGLKLLRFYQVYRALVRAKVLALRLQQPGLSPEEHRHDLDQFDAYLALAVHYTQGQPQQLLLTHGLSGSGKTTFVNELARHIGAICIHSDRERKRLHRLDNAATTTPTPGAIHQGMYSAGANSTTYNHLRQLADIILDAGFSVIIDATFIRQADRRQAIALAANRQCPVRIFDFQINEKLLRQRIRHRTRKGDSLSDADEQVLDFQLAHAEPLSAAEQKISITIDDKTPVETVTGRLIQSSNH